MRFMTIIITGCQHTPEWDTLQTAIRQAIGERGVLTRISRADNGVDYRAPGKYNLNFTPPSGDDITIELDVRS